MNARAEAEPFQDTAWSFSREAEQAVIGSLLLDNAAYDRVATLITERDFYTGEHRAAFRAISYLIESGRGADLVTVFSRMKAEDPGRHGGILPYLTELAQNTPTAANVAHYAEVIRQRSMLRQLYGASITIAESVAGFGGRDAAELLDAAETSLMAISHKSVGRKDFQPVREALGAAVEFIDAQYHRDNPDDPTGVPYGFVDLDRQTSGMHPGQLIILAARPAMGKSAFALNVTEHVARATGKQALFFSLEMSNREQALRLIASGARVNVQRLVTGRLYDGEWQRVGGAMGALSELPIQFNDQASITVNEMRALARRAAREHGKLSLIVIDYVQLMLAGVNDSNRANQVAEISRGLKLLAKELEVPVLALSQLNRELEKRGNKRPVMSDLRDSGALEQDADVILFIYRDEVYHPDTAERGVAEIIVTKQRNGPVGMVRLAFRADATRFDNFAAGAF